MSCIETPKSKYRLCLWTSTSSQCLQILPRHSGHLLDLAGPTPPPTGHQFCNWPLSYPCYHFCVLSGTLSAPRKSEHPGCAVGSCRATPTPYKVSSLALIRMLSPELLEHWADVPSTPVSTVVHNWAPTSCHSPRPGMEHVPPLTLNCPHGQAWGYPIISSHPSHHLAQGHHSAN